MRLIINDVEKDVSVEDIRKLSGKKVIFKEDLRRYADTNLRDLFINYGMAQCGGRQTRIYGAYDYGRQLVFTISGSNNTWPIEFVEKIIDEDYKINQDNNDIEIQIKKGDLVKIKFDDEAENEAEKPIGDFYGIPIFNSKSKSELIEEPKNKFIVADIVNDTILPYYIDNKYRNIVIDKNMVELVEENYVERLKNKKKKTEKDNKILNDLDVIEEMKSKVNVKDFKKIYAGSLRAKPNDLKGVELLLHQWAFNKKHLYQLLGNELSISKEIEYVKAEEDMKGEKEAIYKEFPASYYILKDIENKDILNNKISYSYERDWCKYATGRYEIGTKVSKILNDACKNDRLNTMYSDLIAQAKIRGIIEISINPIEILLMSCNVSGWNSCHRINNIGENKSWGAWSAGIFSYMCDKTSMIAFRHNNKLYDFKIYNSKTQQHSKNWRQMIWINDDFTKFIASRQYPCKMEEITKQVREMLEEQINNYTEEFTWVHSDSLSKIKENIADYKYNSKVDNILHYNDMLHGYSGDLCYKKAEEFNSTPIKVGSNPVCPLCGMRILKNRSIPFCKNCESKVSMF